MEDLNFLLDRVIGAQTATKKRTALTGVCSKLPFRNNAVQISHLTGTTAANLILTTTCNKLFEVLKQTRHVLRLEAKRLSLALGWVFQSILSER